MNDFDRDVETMRNPIHTFFDGTIIDMSSILDVSRPRVANPESPTGNQIVEFAITYKGLEQPRRFQYMVKDLVDGELLGHVKTLASAWSQFLLDRLATHGGGVASKEKDDLDEKSA
jgi:hypothetical protein